MIKCDTCRYGEVHYSKEKDKTTGVLASVPQTVRCGKPGYGKRKYRVNPKAECGSYEKRER